MRGDIVDIAEPGLELEDRLGHLALVIIGTHGSGSMKPFEPVGERGELQS